MKKFVTGRDAEVVAWTSRQIGFPISNASVGLAIVEEEDPTGTILGAVVFTDYTGANVELITCITKVIHRHLIRDCYRYIFDHLKCLRATVRCRRDNAAMRKLYPRLGFKLEVVQKKFFGPNRSDDALQFVLMRSDAERWMN